MNPISAAILAGGRATRLGGADKASLVVGGRRIVERQLEAIGGVADDVCVVIGDVPATGDATRYADLKVRVVPDAIAGAGPLGGVYTALVEARHDRVLVLACDLPFVTAALVERLAAESGATGAHDEVDAVVPRSARGLEPLCAVYSRRCAETARARIARGDLRMTAFLADLRVREIEAGGLAPGDTGTLFENVNTPHDYARARDLVERNENPSEDRITE